MHKIMIMLLSGTLVTMSVPAEAVAGPQFGNALHDNAFDQAGAAQPGATLEYDAANRLRRVKRGSLDIRYIYDGVGNLEAEIVDDGQKVTRTDLLVDESGPLPRVIGALTDDGARELYAYGPMGVAMVRKSAAGQPPATYHALTDEMGTVRGLANEAGALAGRVAYGPFGRVRVTEGEQTRLAFAGEYRDTAGLVWLRARHYAPFLGRFVQRDTVVDDPGNPQSLNRYTYAANNPLSNLDPTGHTVLAVAVVSVVLIGLFVGTLIGANVTMMRNPGGKDPELRRQEALWVDAHGIATGMAGTAAGAHGAASAARARSAALGDSYGLRGSIGRRVTQGSQFIDLDEALDAQLSTYLSRDPARGGVGGKRAAIVAYQPNTGKLVEAASGGDGGLDAYTMSEFSRAVYGEYGLGGNRVGKCAEAKALAQFDRNAGTIYFSRVAKKVHGSWEYYRPCKTCTNAFTPKGAGNQYQYNDSLLCRGNSKQANPWEYHGSPVGDRMFPQTPMVAPSIP